MEAKSKHFEELEVRAMDKLLQSLYEKGLLNDIECRIIVCTSQLPEKQLAFFRIMMSKSKETAAKLGQLFWAMNYNLHTEENLKLQKSDHKSAKNELDSSLETDKNPMLNNTVIKCVFGFLSLEDIKNCRFVSRQWNSTAEILLRKQAKIHFRSDGLRPDTFFAVSNFSPIKVPFSAFKFSEMNTHLSWPKSELEDFFEKWGKNIKELNLHYINIQCTDADDPSKSILLYDHNITPWFKNSSEITSLKIEGSEHDKEELNMSLSLGELKFLSKIKTFIMKGNSIELGKKGTTRMAPVNIDLSNITCKRDSEILQELRYNDYFDFSQAATIRLSNCQKSIISEVTFDMTAQVFENTNLCLDEIDITNWERATGSLKHLELSGIPFTEKNHLKIQSLKISFSVIDLFAIPEKVERVHVYNCNISCNGSLLLKNLKFLKLNWDEDYSAEFTQFPLEMCDNLKELVIWHFGGQETNLKKMFAVKTLPINLQVLRLRGNLSKYLTDKTDDSTWEIPGLVVLEAEWGSSFSDYTRIMNNFRTGTLVLVCYYTMKVCTNEIVKFLLTNMQNERKRIFIGIKDEDDDIDELHYNTPFEGSWISTIVDAKSNYYKFENVFGVKGKAITREKFINGSISIEDESVPVPFFLKEE